MSKWQKFWLKLFSTSLNFHYVLYDVVEIRTATRQSNTKMFKCPFPSIEFDFLRLSTADWIFRNDSDESIKMNERTNNTIEKMKMMSIPVTFWITISQLPLCRPMIYCLMFVYKDCVLLRIDLSVRIAFHSLSITLLLNNLLHNISIISAD